MGAALEGVRQMGVSGPAPANVALQGEECGEGRSGEQPARVAQPDLVGHEEEGRAGPLPLPEPPEAPAEAGPVGCRPLPDQRDHASAGQAYGGVHRQGAIPPEAQGPGDASHGGGEAVDDGKAVEALEQHAPMPGRDGVDGGGRSSTAMPLLLCQPLDAGCGEDVSGGSKGTRSDAWRMEAMSPSRSRVSAAQYAAAFDRPETAAASRRSRKGIEARSCCRAASAGLIARFHSPPSALRAMGGWKCLLR